MATVLPFKALRPDPALAARICELPYDVLSSAEARELAKGNPLSFFHVSKPEIDLPQGTNPYDLKVYQQGKANFSRLIAEGALRQDARPSYYLYRQVMGEHSQLGLVGLSSCEEYQKGVIKKHELTRVDKEDDRVRHIEAVAAQTGPAFLVYPADPALNDCFDKAISQAPDVDFRATDGVRHSAWCITAPESLGLIQSRFATVKFLYIADGHHRTAAAARIAQARPMERSSAFFLTVLFPHDQVQILPYHRVLRDLKECTSDDLLRRLDSIFFVRETGIAQVVRRHDIGLYLDRRWFTLTFRPHLTAVNDAIASLDATLLQKHVLAPIFGIDDPRTSQRIGFVGGIRGTSELEKLVQSGAYACAFSMFATGIADLVAVADAGGIMPPKSTWFEPKLRDGMFTHLL